MYLLTLTHLFCPNQNNVRTQRNPWLYSWNTWSVTGRSCHWPHARADCLGNMRKQQSRALKDWHMSKWSSFLQRTVLGNTNVKGNGIKLQQRLFMIVFWKRSTAMQIPRLGRPVTYWVYIISLHSGNCALISMLSTYVFSFFGRESPSHRNDISYHLLSH